VTAVSSLGKLRLRVKRSSRCVADNVEVVHEQLRLANSMAKKLYVHAVSCAQSLRLAFGIYGISYPSSVLLLTTEMLRYTRTSSFYSPSRHA
jgi:hypothetical protein